MARIRVAAARDLPVGGLRRVSAAGRQVCLVHAEDGHLYAIDDECTHEGASLSEGDLDGMEVQCPLHGSSFDVRSGAVKGLPATIGVSALETVVEGDAVYVDVGGDA